MKNSKNKKNLKASVADLIDQKKLDLGVGISKSYRQLDLSKAVATLSWPVALYKFCQKRSGDMFKKIHN